MSTSNTFDGGGQSQAEKRRTEVLAILRTAEQPMSAAEVGRAAGMHINTARLHLDALVADDLAERATEPRTRPGRPRVLYSSQGPAPGRRSFRLLAEILTGLISTLEDASERSIETGRAWGRHLVDRPPPSRTVDAAEAVERIRSMLDELGFRPEDDEPAVQETGDGTELRLYNCPFREIADEHTDVVCGVHLGMIQGALEELRAPVEVTDLDPFVTPQVCIAHLRASERSEPSP